MRSAAYGALAVLTLLAPLGGEAQAGDRTSVNIGIVFGVPGDPYDGRGYWRSGYYYHDCGPVEEVGHVRGRPAVIVSTVCYDRYGNAYVVAGSTRVVRYLPYGYGYGAPPPVVHFGFAWYDDDWDRGPRGHHHRGHPRKDFHHRGGRHHGHGHHDHHGHRGHHR